MNNSEKSDDIDETNNNDEIYTPDELAWTLIMDENINKGGVLMVFSDVCSDAKETLFDILITIYIEMIFNYYKIKYLENTIDKEEDNEDNINEEFYNIKLDIKKININTLLEVFYKKFMKLNILLQVSEISNEYYNYIKKDRYCTILLKDSPTDETYFIMNEKYLDNTKRYHFVLNSQYEKKNNLRDIYCSIKINDKYYKISFNTVK